MPSIESLTRDDLEEIRRSSYETDDPFVAADLLVDAVAQGRVWDRAEIATALMLAAEIYERTGDLARAESLAGQAVGAHQRYGDPGYGFPQAYWAGLLLRRGQVDRGMAELSALRPLLIRDPLAATYVSEALDSGGMAEVAVGWLTEALATALARAETTDPREPDEVADQAAFVVYNLAQRRRELRAALRWGCDEYDGLAQHLKDQLGQALDDATQDDDDYNGIAVLFWPSAEFDRLLAWWPHLAGVYGADWDDHRGQLERHLSLLWETGRTGLAVMVGAAGELAQYAAELGGDPGDVAIRQGYAEVVDGQQREIAWPPGRNEACWCGAPHPYRLCCRRRSDEG